MGKPVYIEADLMRAAEQTAAERGVDVEAVVSELARRSLAEPAPPSASKY
jgi:hypothetical protein